MNPLTSPLPHTRTFAHTALLLACVSLVTSGCSTLENTKHAMLKATSVSYSGITLSAHGADRDPKALDCSAWGCPHERVQVRIEGETTKTTRLASAMRAELMERGFTVETSTQTGYSYDDHRLPLLRSTYPYGCAPGRGAYSNAFGAFYFVRATGVKDPVVITQMDVVAAQGRSN